MLALALDVHPTKTSQAVDPAFTKIAKLFRIDPTATLEAIIEASRDLEPMTEHELAARELMQTGKLDRSVLHSR